MELVKTGSINLEFLIEFDYFCMSPVILSERKTITTLEAMIFSFLNENSPKDKLLIKYHWKT